MHEYAYGVTWNTQLRKQDRQQASNLICIMTRIDSDCLAEIGEAVTVRFLQFAQQVNYVVSYPVVCHIGHYVCASDSDSVSRGDGKAFQQQLPAPQFLV